MERFSQSEVKVQGHDQTERYNGGDMQFDVGVASTFTGFLLSAEMSEIVIISAYGNIITV